MSGAEASARVPVLQTGHVHLVAGVAGLDDKGPRANPLRADPLGQQPGEVTVAARLRQHVDRLAAGRGRRAARKLYSPSRKSMAAQAEMRSWVEPIEERTNESKNAETRGSQPCLTTYSKSVRLSSPRTAASAVDASVGLANASLPSLPTNLYQCRRSSRKALRSCRTFFGNGRSSMPESQASSYQLALDVVLRLDGLGKIAGGDDGVPVAIGAGHHAEIGVELDEGRRVGKLGVGGGDAVEVPPAAFVAAIAAQGVVLFEHQDVVVLELPQPPGGGQSARATADDDRVVEFARRRRATREVVGGQRRPRARPWHGSLRSPLSRASDGGQAGGVAFGRSVRRAMAVPPSAPPAAPPSSVPAERPTAPTSVPLRKSRRLRFRRRNSRGRGCGSLPPPGTHATDSPPSSESAVGLLGHFRPSDAVVVSGCKDISN